jgi:hypothetical protein
MARCHWRIAKHEEPRSEAKVLAYALDTNQFELNLAASFVSS